VGSILTLRNIGYRYDGEDWAIKGVDLDVREGEVLGILGPNGSGKSTLLKVMDKLLIPQEGDIKIRGISYHGIKRAAFAREVAMVAQENHFRFSFSCLEVVLMGRFPHLKRLQFEGKRDMDAAINALRVTHALELADRSIYDLSGGEKQRVLLARALAQEPKVILLDEPTSFLDLKYRREIFRMISSLSREKAVNVVLVSHDIDLAAHYCHRLVVLKNGRVFAIGEPDEVVTTQAVEDVYECPVLVDRHPLSGKPRVNIN
jgi:iron complex transport system ATP-binding protein